MLKPNFIILQLILLAGVFSACQQLPITDTSLAPGTVVDTREGLVFTIPDQIMQTETYVLGEYSHDKKLIIFLKSSRKNNTGFSIMVRKETVETEDDFIDIINEHQSGFDMPKTIGKQKFGQPKDYDHLLIDSVDSWGTRITRNDGSGYVIYTQHGSNAYIMTFATQPEFETEFQRSFQQFYESIQFP